MINSHHIIIVLIVYILIRELMHKSERKDLYNRIMCRDLSDYNRAADISKGKAKSAISAHKKVLEEWKNGGGGA